MTVKDLGLNDSGLKNPVQNIRLVRSVRGSEYPGALAKSLGTSQSRVHEGVQHLPYVCGNNEDKRGST